VLYTVYTSNEHGRVKTLTYVWSHCSCSGWLFSRVKLLSYVNIMVVQCPIIKFCKQQFLQ